MLALETIKQLLQKGTAAHKDGDLATAEILYKQVLDIDPNQVDATHYLALIAQTVDRHDVAVLLLEKAISFCPDDANIRYNLGLSLHRLEKLEEAKQQYFAAIKSNPNMALPYNNLGVIYQQEGLHEKANTLFEKAINLDTSFADAYYNLSQGTSYKKEPVFLDKIEGLLRQENLSIGNEIICHFALGKIYDDIGLYDQAFSHYQKGNDLKETSFNIEAYEKYVASIMDTFTSTGMSNKNLKKNLSSEIIFIIGMPRSGTSLVEQIISSHSKVTGGGELGFVGNLIDNIDDLIEIETPYPLCINDISQQQIDVLADRLLIDMERRFPGHEKVTDKTPINFLHVGLITLLFPQSKIIYCQRDPLDVCLSCYFQNFNQQHHYTNKLDTLGKFYNLHHKLMSHWTKQLPNRILSVEYEKLVSSGEAEIRRVIEFCELEWENDCLKHEKNVTKVKTASNWQVRQPLYKSSVKRWKNYESHLQELIDTLNR